MPKPVESNEKNNEVKPEVKPEKVESENIEKGISEMELGESENIEDIKQKLLSLGESEEKEEEVKETGETEEEGEISGINIEIEIDEQDAGELYLNVFYIISLIMGIKLPEEFKKRAIRRGKLIKKIIEKYADSETAIWVILISDVASDMFYLIMLYNEKKKNKEGDENGQSH